MSRGSSCILRNDDFEALLEQVAQVRFDAHVCQHSTKNDFADAALTQLQNKVIGLRTKHSVGTYDDSLAIINVRFEALEPVGTRPGEAFETQSSAASKHLGLSLVSLERSVEFPSTVSGKEIVRRNEDLESVLLSSLEDPLHILDRLVLSDTLADRSPRKPFIAQDLILRIDEDHCSVVFVYIHDSSDSHLLP